jgi:hypothetical protein
MCGVNNDDATESLTAAARRYGRSTTCVSEVLQAAGVYQRDGNNRGKGGLQLRVADVDRAMQAHLRTVAKPTVAAVEAVAPVRPVDAHVPDAEGRVGCGACWAMAWLSRHRVVVCRWCREGEAPCPA